MSKKKEPRTSSPAATGQAGAFFEQHVDAAWLSLLLVGGLPPILIDTQVCKVSFQTSHLGWKTDDVLILGKTGDNKTRKLIAQVKRTLTVSRTNEDCCKTFGALWSDFNSANFDQSTDRLCITVLRGTNTLLAHLAGLFDCALNSNSVEDFEHRFTKDGLLHAIAKKHVKEIRDILEADGTPIANDAFWKFLRCLSILSFDLNTSTRQTEASIKSLLAQTAGGPDQIGAAKATWESLLAIVSSAMPGAREFTRDDLPHELRERHSTIAGSDYVALRTLREHSETILRGITGTIGGKASLAREAIINNTKDLIEDTQILVLSGPAGYGKSNVAKAILEQVGQHVFTFAFRAEEFEESHIDKTLSSAGFKMSGEHLSRLLAAQGKKVLLVESLERLLESSVRESFADLLRLIQGDETWKLIITCRSYSIDVVVASFLEQMAVQYSVANIPELSNEELDEVQQSIPQLSLPLSNERLKKLLRNPYVLDKAARMKWGEGLPLPGTEREFRRKFWREIVRQEDVTEGGMPQKREQALTEVAVRRAKHLSLFARCDGLDPEVLGKLKQRDLLTFSQATDTMAAPSHDVLEDWALLNWIETRFAQHESEVKKLAADIGTYPALRRSYRMWLSEKSELEPEIADAHVQATIKEMGLPAHFRDDSVVSILRSISGNAFIERNVSELIADKSKLLKRVVHLLRVACKAAPVWLEGSEHVHSSLMVPLGPAWPPTLKMVHEHIEDFLPKDSLLVLGLIEDWSNIVSVPDLHPNGYEDAAAIAFRLLDVFDGYRDDNRQRVFNIISKTPSGSPDAFLQLLDRGGDHDNEDRVASEFADYLVEGVQSAFVVKQYPDAITELTRNHLYLGTDHEDKRHHRYREEIETYFGLQGHREFYPPSAFRGPFHPLLQFHFKKGIEFIVELANHCTDYYAHPRSHDPLEPAWEVEITLPDGTATKQWHNPRLWQLYRGTSVGPYVLMCALMALESRLLTLGKLGSEYLDSWLLYLIRKSDGSSLSAVVASVVTAYPEICQDAAKALLSCRDFVQLDEQMAVLPNGISHVQGMLPTLNSEAEIYEAERRSADALPHRKKHLGTAALQLQMGSCGTDIHKIIDRHRASLPPIEKQSEADQVWRLCLHRMDLRKYAARNATLEELGQVAESSDAPKRVVLEPTAPEEDLKTMIDRERPRFESSNLLIGLLNWGYSSFGRDGKADSAKWRTYLEQAIAATKVPPDNDEGSSLPWQDGPILIAAVCARDHWTDLSELEKSWVIEHLCSAILRDRDSHDDLVRVSRNSMSGDRSAAVAITSILAQERTGTYRERAVQAIADALTHACDEVALYAAAGIGEYLWVENSELALKCVRALATWAKEADQKIESERQQPFDERDSWEAVALKHGSQIRAKWTDTGSFTDANYETLDFDEPFASEALKRMLHIFGEASQEPEAHKFFKKVTEQICSWWRADSRKQRVPHHLLHACSERVAAFVLKLSEEDAVTLCQPFIELVDEKPREVSSFLQDLVSAEDRTHLGRKTFWRVWDEFAKQAIKASWLKHLDSEYFSGQEFLRVMFLGLHWKRGVKTWKPHEGFEDRIVSFFEALPPSSVAFEQMSIYLYYIGDMTLPTAYLSVANKIEKAPEKFSSKTLISFFEQSLLRHVYGNLQNLKAKPEIRQAVVRILDELVEKGSSAAFRMRDDFVTPVKL